MIRLNNRITVFKGLAWLIFTAILVNLAFLSPLTAFARNEPQLNFQKAAPWQQQAAEDRPPSEPRQLLEAG